MQTTIQNQEAIRKGSTRVQIGNSFASLVDVGALRNPVFTSLVENQTIEFDNVPELKKYTKGRRAQFAFDLCEINLTHLAMLDAGWLTISSTPATPVAVTGEALGTGWTVGQPIKIANKNGANTIVTSVVVDADGSPLVLNTNYRLYVADGTNGELGYTYIVPLTTSTAVLDVDYSYTPNASKRIQFGDFGNKTLTVMRIVNTDETGKVFKIDIENGTNFAPVSIDFASDTEADVAVLPIQFQGDVVDIVDEQQVT